MLGSVPVWAKTTTETAMHLRHGRKKFAWLHNKKYIGAEIESKAVFKRCRKSQEKE